MTRAVATAIAVAFATTLAAAGADLPYSVAQGGLAFGRVPPGVAIEIDGGAVRVSARGEYVLAAARDAVGTIDVTMIEPGGARHMHRVLVTPRKFAIEVINGVPPSTVDPPPAIAARIAREQAAVAAARTRDDDRQGWRDGFKLPVTARVSGVFGSQRIYNGKPGAPHSGFDLAAPQGTPVRAPAAGVVTFAATDLYLTGGTVVLDHGHGLSSTFLHLSRIDSRVGAKVTQGEVIGAVGATGRATGPHLHWGMNLFETRVDPQLLIDH
ncbi:MAG: M23 family metallopeptidase [Lysobacterales bacterium]